MTEPVATVVALDELADFDFSSLSTEAHHRIMVTTSRWILPFLLVPKARATALLVMQNGAVDHSRVTDVVFQRSSWSEDIDHHQLYFFDPTTGTPDQLSLGWGQGNRDNWIFDDVLTAVRHISNGLGVTSPLQRVHFGSSAGGFMALTLMALDEGSTAVVNNAQFDWTRWMPTGLNPLRAALFDNMLPADLRSQFPIRTSVLRLFSEIGRPLAFRYYVNMASKHDREIDYPMLHEFMITHPGLCGNIRITHYCDSRSGHNPLARTETISILNSL
ncbi:hypothetical protein ACT4S2_00365 [Kocuria turfanensis]|uniref:hypothetical protein n=1 Tax=Kocuria turfanensis TaxID=388357 RepID=UPI004035E820